MSAPTDPHDEPDRRRPAACRGAPSSASAAASPPPASPPGFGVGRATAPEPAAGDARPPGTYPFTGVHQAGIVTPAQDRLYLAAFDLTTTSRDELVALLRRWTTIAARLTQGLSAGPFGPASGPYDAPPDDTGEAADLPPGRA